MLHRYSIACAAANVTIPKIVDFVDHPLHKITPHRDPISIDFAFSEHYPLYRNF
jgi:hypothetical protein